MKQIGYSRIFGAILAMCLAAPSWAATLPGALPTGWGGVGGYGVGTPDGDMTSPPDGAGYAYVSTAGGLAGVGSLPGVGGSGTATNGSMMLTSSFSAQAGEALTFSFNYITSDGAGYSDYAWARLLDEDGHAVALLFTARTTPLGNSVPGFAMPSPDATLTPTRVGIDHRATEWSALGGDSGACYDLGCGGTGWVDAAYEIASAGTYRLQIGVTNWDDTFFDSGMAIAGAQIGGVSISPGQPAAVPLPASGWLLIMGMGALAAGRNRRRG